MTTKHNAEGCIKEFVENEIWGRLKHREDMWCEIEHKPLINTKIYTKDWAFKVVGSTKWCDREYHKLPFPTKQLFFATRMADRIGNPTFSDAWLQKSQTRTTEAMTACNSQIGTRIQHPSRDRSLKLPEDSLWEKWGDFLCSAKTLHLL